MVVLTCLSGPDTVSCLSFSNKLLVRGFENGSIHLSPPNDCASFIVLCPSSEPCTAVAFAGEDSDVFYSSHGGNIVFWDLRNYGTPVNVLKVSIDEINCIDVNTQDECLAVADDVGMVSLVSAANRKVTRVLKNHDNICSAAKFLPTCQNQLISCGLDCRLVVCDWKNGDNKRKVIEMASLDEPSRFANFLNEYLNEGGAPHRRKGNKRSNECAASIHIASSLTPEEVEQMVTTRALGPGLSFNPPMIHSLGCDDSGDYVTVGLGNGTVEVFQSGKNLQHVATLLGHRRSVAALLPVGKSHLLSGGDDCCIFLWEVSRGGAGQRFVHSEKIGAFAGHDLARIYVADNTTDVKVMDLTCA
ncbi:WD repeat-containing protein 53 [Taenia crassiceps]|uniref:WD repeat-containing protein 53 n=1 Tax=Taenia crassiceps TaxID=6207 RepID=A0ABR4Q172_9CEST